MKQINFLMIRDIKICVDIVEETNTDLVVEPVIPVLVLVQCNHLIMKLRTLLESYCLCPQLLTNLVELTLDMVYRIYFWLPVS